MATIANVLTGIATIYTKAAGTAPAASVNDQIGYTEDGVTIEYTPTVADIEVEEETFAINRVITKEEITVTLNCAENTATFLLLALAGGAAGIILDGGVLQDFALRIVGTSPAPAPTRTIYIPYAHTVGTVTMSYKKGEKTIIPITFKAFKSGIGVDVCTISDA